jgi:hypothetical protein
MDKVIHFDDALASVLRHLVKAVTSSEVPDHVRSMETDIVLPRIADTYLRSIDIPPDRLPNNRSAWQYYRPFYDAAWQLCRSGILRPGRIAPRQMAVADATGDYFSITEFGRRWLVENAAQMPSISEDPGRLAQALNSFASRYGPAFAQRATEAALCHRLGAYLAACVMSGAAAESIFLAVAIEKSQDEEATLKAYSVPGGRAAIIKTITSGLKSGLANEFTTHSQLLTYWRDEAAHGRASAISEIEAFMALGRLHRFALFAQDKWSDLTA